MRYRLLNVSALNPGDGPRGAGPDDCRQATHAGRDAGRPSVVKPDVSDARLDRGAVRDGRARLTRAAVLATGGIGHLLVQGHVHDGVVRGSPEIGRSPA